MARVLAHELYHVLAGTESHSRQGVTQRDNDFSRRWDEISRDRDGFVAWMEEHVLAGAVVG